MFFSFSLFPPGISARCSRRVFPPVVPGLRCRPDFRPAFPPAVLGSRNVSALRLPLGACPFLPAFLPCGPSPRFRPAFPPGVWVCATACYSRSAFPPGISLRRGLARGAFPRSACLWGLVRFCTACFLHAVTSAYGKKRACRNPDVGLQRCGACRRDRSFEPAGGSVSGGIRAVRAAKLHIIP